MSSSALRTACPSAGSASSSSPLARATSSRPPKNSAWAIPMLVMTPMVGRATAARVAMWPTPRAPISATTASAPVGADSSVSGTPISLLNDTGLAPTGPAGASAAAVRSLVEVLPVLPVMPTTGTPPRRSRAARPRAVSAAAVSSTSTEPDRPPPAGRRAHRRRPGSRASATKSCPSRSARSATNSAAGHQGAGVDGIGGRQRCRVAAQDLPAGDPGDLGRG